MDGNSAIQNSKRARQLKLTKSIRDLEILDWNFADQQSDSPFSDLHWHPCRFPSQIPGLLIRRLASPGDRILDPFMGSGTTLAEAQRLGVVSVGYDINPVACLMARAKTLPWSGADARRFANRLKLELAGMSKTAPPRAPSGVQGEKWFTPRTLAELNRIYSVVRACLDGEGYFAKAIFSSILLPACREDRHWGYVCDNTMPKSNRERDVALLFNSALDRFTRAYEWRDGHSHEQLSIAEIRNANTLLSLPDEPQESFDGFITSPPYYGVADYVKAQRLSMEWFGEGIEELRQQEVGARSKRHRKLAYSEYLDELEGTFRQIFRVLKKDSWGAIVFGESPARTSASSDFKARLEEIGFAVSAIFLREIPEQRRLYPSLRNEELIVVRKK